MHAPAAQPAVAQPAAAAVATMAPVGPAPVPPRAPAAPARVAAPAARKTQSDVLAELERIRKQALSSRQPAAASAQPAAANGKHEINREIQLSLKRSDFDRAKRFLLTLQVEDGQHQVMEAVKDFQVEIGSTAAEHQKVVLCFNIALRTKE